jgi:hypothetical protein
VHLQGHERFDINNDELLKTIWKHTKWGEEGGKGIFLSLDLGKGITLIDYKIICVILYLILLAFNLLFMDENSSSSSFSTTTDEIHSPLSIFQYKYSYN